MLGFIISIVAWGFCCAVWAWAGYQHGRKVQLQIDRAKVDDLTARIETIINHYAELRAAAESKPDYIDHQ